MGSIYQHLFKAEKAPGVPDPRRGGGALRTANLLGDRGVPEHRVVAAAESIAAGARHREREPPLYRLLAMLFLS